LIVRPRLVMLSVEVALVARERKGVSFGTRTADGAASASTRERWTDPLPASARHGKPVGDDIFCGNPAIIARPSRVTSAMPR